jgi:hypothetical protein
MPITFPNNVIKAEGVQIRLYSNISTRTLAAGTTPYIKHTETPKFSWVAQGVENAGPLSYRVQITWIGNGAIVPIEEINVPGITTNSFAVGVFQRLKYILAADAGGAYEIIITASQSGQPDAKIGGQFRVNFKPTPPINLQVT